MRPDVAHVNLEGRVVKRKDPVVRNRCDWRQVCVIYEAPGRVGALDVVMHDGTEHRFEAKGGPLLHWDDEDGALYADRDLVGVALSMTPVVEPGDKITQYRTCLRRAGHRSRRHGVTTLRYALRIVRHPIDWQRYRHLPQIWTAGDE